VAAVPERLHPIEHAAGVSDTVISGRRPRPRIFSAITREVLRSDYAGVSCRPPSSQGGSEHLAHKRRSTTRAMRFHCCLMLEGFVSFCNWICTASPWLTKRRHLGEVDPRNQCRCSFDTAT